MRGFVSPIVYPHGFFCHKAAEQCFYCPHRHRFLCCYPLHNIRCRRGFLLPQQLHNGPFRQCNMSLFIHDYSIAPSGSPKKGMGEINDSTENHLFSSIASTIRQKVFAFLYFIAVHFFLKEDNCNCQYYNGISNYPQKMWQNCRIVS